MKPKIQNIMLISALVLMFGLSACNPTSSSTGDTPVITVSILPQQYFLQRLAGDYFDVNVMVEPGESPENYEPTAQQMRALSESVAYISIGVQFENVWMEKIQSANKEMLIIDSSAGIKKLTMVNHIHEDEEHEGEDHEHEGEEHEDEEHEGEEHHHEEGELDPHVWMSPRLVKIQAQNITEALIRLDPQHEQEYLTNLESFLADIDALDQDLSDQLSGVTKKSFMIFHPAMGYFAADYGLTQIPIEIGGTEPSAQELARFIEEAKEEDVHVIFVQPEFSKRSAETIAQEINGTVQELFVLSPDWLNNMRTIGQTIAEANQ